VKAHAVFFARKTGVVEKFFGAAGVERVLRDVGFVGPVIGRKDAARNLRLAAEEIADEGSAVCGEGERLTNLLASKERVPQIDAEVGEVGAGALRERKRWLLDEDGNDVGGERTHFEVGGAFAEFESADHGVGDDSEMETFHLRVCKYKP